jgi:hypothetical protein
MDRAIGGACLPKRIHPKPYSIPPFKMAVLNKTKLKDIVRTVRRIANRGE